MKVRRLLVGAFVASAIIIPVSTMTTAPATADSVIPKGINFDSDGVDITHVDVIRKPKCSWTDMEVSYRKGKTVTQRTQVCVVYAAPGVVFG